MKKLKQFLLAIWELPQNVLGAACVKMFKGEFKCHYNDAKIYTWKFPYNSMSLGKFIFIGNKVYGTRYMDNTLKHEYGHTIQSKYLGWLYLPVIGLPSLGWAWLGEGFRVKHKKTYYWFYTESWANKLGGVEREEE